MEWIRKLFRKPGPSGFGYSSTAEEALRVGLAKRARVLALRGARVIILARTVESGIKVKESLLQDNPNAKLDVMEMDLSPMDSVKAFARSFLNTNYPLNVLINSAGIMACPFQLSKDGIELQFATNHLGHFLLTNLLLGKLKSTAKESGIEGRIVSISSLAHRRTYSSGILFDKINYRTGYSPYAAYGQSKLANILHANELARRWQEEGANVTANSLHPGVIPTNIARYMKFLGIQRARLVEDRMSHSYLRLNSLK
ncbi:hypothetical protein AMTR_s00107p00149370 [Amborella trichopoda]|uniref:Uncharacterized protein n=1 Tax=Amborella trichopoda TaxID=13333 RepID=W1NXE0_AMBTC|nr:hypothetical protein AMTR_s00107p00149370 [Amborella trichopoda]